MKLTATVHLESDFHISSGEGFAGTVDSTVVLGDEGTPVIPASTLKGLCRWHAERLLELAPVQQMIPRESHAAVLERLFGSEGARRASVWFHNAVLELGEGGEFAPAAVHGRSARDLTSGTTQRGAFFRYEDAPAATFVGELTTEDEPDAESLLLLIMALRRIEALGGQRRRGKGRCHVSVCVDESASTLDGLTVPNGDDTRFRSILEKAFRGKLGDVGVTPGGGTPKKDDGTEQDIEPPNVIGQGCLLLVARAVEPVVVTDDPETGNVIGTLDYLPGTVIRGAIAHRLLNTKNDPWRTTEPRFRETFTFECVRFGPLYPTAEKPKPGTGTFSFPAPAAVQSCKCAPGVIESAEDVARIHGSVNVLWNAVPVRCQHRSGGLEACNAAVVPLGGYLQGETPGEEDWELRTALPRRRSIQRTEIHDRTLSSQEQRLYSTEVIPADTWFTGYVWGPRDRLQELANYIAVEHRNRLRLRVGKSLTRGHGAIEVAVSASDADMHAVYPMLLPRSHDKKNALPGSEFDGTARQPDEFSLYLYSDLIAVDKYLRPVTSLDKEGCKLWRAVLGQAGAPPFQIVSGYCATRRVGGFNGEAGLPRTPDIAMVAGSCWRLRWRNDTAKAKAIPALHDAVCNGAGLRRGEGFGAMIVNLPLLDYPLDQPANEEHRFEIPFSASRTVKLPVVEPRNPRLASEPELLERQKKLLEKLPKFADGESDVAVGLARLLSTIADFDAPAQVLKGAIDSRSGYCSMHGKYTWQADDRLTLDSFDVRDEPHREKDASGLVASLKHFGDYPKEEQAMLYLLDESQRCNTQDFQNLIRQYVRRIAEGSTH